MTCDLRVEPCGVLSLLVYLATEDDASACEPLWAACLERKPLPMRLNGGEEELFRVLGCSMTRSFVDDRLTIQARLRRVEKSVEVAR